MGILTAPDGTPIPLRPAHLTGRSRAAALQLHGPEVSGQHAIIAWHDGRWTVRDVGSRNGTVVGGALLGVGDVHVLAVGDQVAFGDAECVYGVRSVGPPVPAAVNGTTLIEGDDGILAIPSADDPQVLVTQDELGRWRSSVDERILDDGDDVVHDGITWRVQLPETLERTRDVAHRHSLRPRLDFRVSSDEEYVELTVNAGSGPTVLRPRAHQYVLLILARARLADAAADVPSAECGWLYTADLVRMLGGTRNQLYVSLHRARKELEGHGMAGSLLIERRSTSQQIRIGLDELSVESF